MSNVVAAVRDWVAAHRDDLIGELASWVGQPSVSTTGEGMPAAAAHAARLLRSAGLEVRTVPTPGWPVVLGSAPGRPGAPHVLVYGHYDVQPPGPLADWTSPPFTPEVRDGRMYGRGTGDNKAQHLAHLLGLRALLATTGKLPCPVTVVLDGEEEITSPHLAEAVRTGLDQRPDLMVWSDGPVHESGRACVLLGVRGVLTFSLRARGAPAPLHSGNWGGVASNPAWTLVQLLASMRDTDGTVLVDGFADDVAPLTEGERAALAAAPVDVPAALAQVGITALEPPADAGFFARLTAPTFTINSLSCEDGDEHRTVIPATAVARCDIRLVGGQRVDTVVEALRRHVAAHAPGVELTVTGSLPPSRTLPESRYTDVVVAAAAEGLGEPPVLMPAYGGSLPIGLLDEVLGVPSYGIPLANVDELNHAANENIELDWFLRGIVAAAAVQHRLGAAG